MKTDLVKLEYTRIQRVAREYAHRGYRVTLRPGPTDLPEFLAAFQPDLIAQSDDETVVVEVKTRRGLSQARDLGDLARALEGRPGWRFEFIVTNPKGSSTVPDEADLAEPWLLDRRLVDAQRMAEARTLDAAMLLAWSAAEGTLRHISEREGVYVGRRGPSYLIKHLYSLGLLSREVYDVLDEGLRLRNSLIHGFTVRDLGATTVMNFIQAARALLDHPAE